jgi:hypothetical protein
MRASLHWYANARSLRNFWAPSVRNLRCSVNHFAQQLSMCAWHHALSAGKMRVAARRAEFALTAPPRLRQGPAGSCHPLATQAQGRSSSPVRGYRCTPVVTEHTSAATLTALHAGLGFSMLLLINEGQRPALKT